MEAPDGIPGSVLTGPFPSATYAAALRDRLRGFTRVQVFGEVFGFKAGRAKVWFELRDAGGRAAVLDVARGLREAAARARWPTARRWSSRAGATTTPGSRTASPGFSFAVTRLRVAGEGDLLAQLEQLRRKLHAEGLFAPQKALALPKLPRCIGVVTGESGKARDDVLAGLRRRGWAGRLVWGFAPVQDRHAAPAIARALQDLAACEEVEVIVVARGGGSLADLFAFCDETLCRTVALLRVPVISSVGHHTDRTLLDDVAAVACSTPTHAAETAVPVDCTAARAALATRPPPAGAPGPPRRARPRPHARPALTRAGAPRRPPPHPPAPAAARAARRDPPRDRRRRAPDARARPRRWSARRPPPRSRRRPRRAPRARRTPPRWTARRPPRSSAAAATSTASSPRSPPTTRSARWSAATRWSRTRGRAGHERGAAPAPSRRSRSACTTAA